MNCHINKNKKAALIILLISLLLIIIITLVYKLLFNKQNNDFEWTEIQLDSSELNNLQLSADNGHRPGMLDPKEVAMDTLMNQLKIDTVDSVEILKKKKDLCLVEITLQNRRKVKMKLFQPVTKGRTGIWAVKAYSISKK